MTPKAKARHYEAVGSVRGSCSHCHLSIRAAVACVRKDQAACKKLGGYSDRRVACISGPLSDDELETLEIEELRAGLAG